MIRGILLHVIFIPPFFCFRPCDLPDKDFIPLRDLCTEQQSGYRSTLVRMSRVESRAEQKFLNEIRTWNIESKDSAAAMNEEKIALQSG
jgi:hypothetical protein